MLSSRALTLARLVRRTTLPLPSVTSHATSNRFQPSPLPTSLVPHPFLATATFLPQSRLLSTSHSSWFPTEEEEKKEVKKEGIVAKFKRMTKDYWYVLIPVHVATSTVWMGGFFLMIKSGVDIPAALRYLGTSDAYIAKIEHSEWANLALAYACYKIATPARYTITVGGTTFTVKYLNDKGYLKTSKEVGEKLKERKERIQDKMEDEWENAWKRFAQKKRHKEEEK